MPKTFGQIAVDAFKRDNDGKFASGGGGGAPSRAEVVANRASGGGGTSGTIKGKMGLAPNRPREGVVAARKTAESKSRRD